MKKSKCEKAEDKFANSRFGELDGDTRFALNGNEIRALARTGVREGARALLRYARKKTLAEVHTRNGSIIKKRLLCIEDLEEWVDGGKS